MSARKFASTNVDVFDEDLEKDVVERYEEQILERPLGHEEKIAPR